MPVVAQAAILRETEQPLTVEIGSLNVTDGTNTITHVTNELEHIIGGQADDIFLFTSDGSSLPALGTIDGQAGTNWLDYVGYTATSANVDLSAGTAQGVPGGISNIVNVLGGGAADTITGDGNVNLLDGRAGTDTITGLAGDDLIIGGPGADLLLDGGAGSDVYQFFDGDGNDNIADSGPAVDIDVGVLYAGVVTKVDPVAEQRAAAGRAEGALGDPDVVADIDVEDAAVEVDEPVVAVVRGGGGLELGDVDVEVAAGVEVDRPAVAVHELDVDRR